MSIHKYNPEIIENCSYLAYIDTHADVKWLCMPRFDSSFLFGPLLYEDRGGHLLPAKYKCAAQNFLITYNN
jgi:glucoamylase